MALSTNLAVALRHVRARVRQGWTKLNDNGSMTCFGSCPGCDLYRAVVELGPGSPTDAVFDLLARRVIDLYPDRVRCDLKNPYDARIIIMEFNDAPATVHSDVLGILAPMQSVPTVR